MSRGIRLWAALFWLVLWQLAGMALDREFLLSTPLSVLQRLLELCKEPMFWRAAGFSLLRISGGFLLAVAAGTALAAAAFRFRRVEELLAPLMIAIKSIPVASFIILALIWFSSKNLSVFISFLMVLPVIYTNVLSGIASCDAGLLEMGRVFGLSAWRRVRYIYIPSAFPHFLSALNVALGLCWKAGIAAELIGVPRGSIGERLHEAKLYLATADVFAWTLTVVLLCILFERLVLLLADRAARLLERV